MPNKFGFDGVSYQANVGAVQAAIGAYAQTSLQEINGSLPTKYGAELLAEADARRSRMANGRSDQVATAEFKKRSMAHSIAGCPVENTHCITVCHKTAQALASLVPIDEEHDHCADRF